MKVLIPLAILLTATMMTDTPLKANDAAAPQPPAAKKAPKADVLHGERRLDDFYWLLEKPNPKVIGYLEAENAYTAALMKPTEAWQEEGYLQIVARLTQPDLSLLY